MNIPSITNEPLANREIVDSSHAGKLRASKHLPVVLKAAIVALVVALLQASSPTAIARFVIPVIVDSLDGATIRSLAHVTEEAKEAQPFITNGNPTTAPVFVVRQFGISASLHHTRPRIVGRGSDVAMLVWRHEIMPHAAARLAKAATEIAGKYSDFGAAVACALPHDAALCARESGGYKSPESLSGKVVEFSHIRIVANQTTPTKGVY